MAKSFKLKNNTYLDIESIVDGVTPLKEKLSKLTILYDGEISTKGVFTLKDNVSNYDFIIIIATENVWGHYRMATMLRQYLYIDFNQYIQYSPTGYTYVHLEENRIDTTDSAIGSNNIKITGIYGIKF